MTTKRIAFLGPAGTYTEEACIRYDPQAKRVPFASVPAVGEAVVTGMADEGVVAIENSLEGSVPDTLDLLIRESVLKINRELVLPIEHCLLGKEGTEVEKVQVVYSHPQALAQSRRFLERCFPKAHLAAALSTTAAVQEMLQSSVPAAAVGNARAAELYGAAILAKAIQDSPNNVTRFVVLAKHDHPRTGNDKTSLCFSFDEDKPGLLYKVMGEFATRGVNLAKVESRPPKQELGSYIFLIDCDGHRDDPKVKEALERVKAMASMFKVFGSYPRYKNG